MNPLLMDVPMPIRTPRLLICSTQPGDGVGTAAAIAETWDELHAWMVWAERLDAHTVEQQELRIRDTMVKLILREEFNLVGVEMATGQPVICCGFHTMDWEGRQCDIGYWVRKSVQGRGFATEATHALLRYAFEVLGMRRVGLTHAGGNDASQRVAEKLKFTREGILRWASLLPGGRVADKHCYARFDTLGLPEIEVRWGIEADSEGSAEA